MPLLRWVLGLGLVGVAASAASFDYYVLSLSWSPQYCAGRPNDRVQCAGSRSFGFVLHGLWPQYERGGYPADCAGRAAPDRATLRAMLDIMPSEKLVRHEWAKHGTCDGMEPREYFAKARRAFEGFRPPEGYPGSRRNVAVRPADYRAAVTKANPALKQGAFALVCSGRYLSEVRVCLDNDLQPRACGRDVRDSCRAPEMIVRPLR